MTAYARPALLSDALALRAAGARVLAGGTDVYPLGVPRGDVLDLTAVAELRGIAVDGGLRIGAATTWTDLAEADLPEACAALQMAARMVGGRQVQNAGTIGGNLCNTSPAADGVPPLLVLAALVELASVRGIRKVPLAAFLLGPRRVDLAADEVLVAVHIPGQALAGRSVFLKLGVRAHLVISIASVAVRMVSVGGLVTDIAIAVGACSAVPQRLAAVERALLGQPLADLAGRVQANDVARAIGPIDDVRATAGYRVQAAVELVKRAVAL